MTEKVIHISNFHKKDSKRRTEGKGTGRETVKNPTPPADPSSPLSLHLFLPPKRE